MKRRARNTVSHSIDLLLSRDLFGHADCLFKARLDIVFHAPDPLGTARIAPAHNKQCITLLGDPFDQAVFGLEVENIKLVDPWRENKQRCLMHLFCGGLILDQLQHLVAKHNRAFARRHIAPKLKGALVTELDQKLAIICFHIGHKVLKPAHKALAFCLHGPLQRVGVRPEEIARGHHRNNLLRKVIQPPFVFGVHILDIVNSLTDCVGIDQVLLLYKVKIRMRLPQRVAKTLVIPCIICGRLEAFSDERFLSCDKMLNRFTPIFKLMLINPLRILHHFRPIVHSCLRIKLCSRTTQGRVHSFPSANREHQSLCKRLNPLQISLHFVKIFIRDIIFCCHLNKIPLSFSAMQHNYYHDLNNATK